MSTDWCFFFYQFYKEEQTLVCLWFLFQPEMYKKGDHSFPYYTQNGQNSI